MSPEAEPSPDPAELAQERARRALWPPTSFERYRGDWAVVTGGSRGLGMGYAVALAQRGLNVALIARSAVDLERVARRLREEHAVDTRTIVADLSRGDAFPTIQVALEPLDRPVSVLVNSVGGAPPEALEDGRPRLDLEPRRFQAYLALNTHPMMHMTQMLLPGMLARDHGYVLNVASLNGLTACEGASMYCAAKAYVIAYSACLEQDLKRRGAEVAVECVCPGRVATDGILRGGVPSEDVPDPIAFASQSLDCARTPHVKIPWLKHWELRRRYGLTGHFDLT